MSRKDETRELAIAAQQLALEARLSSGVQGLMLEAIIGLLAKKGALTKEELNELFFRCDNLVEREISGDQMAAEMARSMRGIIENVAKSFGVDLASLRAISTLSMHRKN